MKAKGTKYERELVNLFWEAGFGVVRVPTSGGATSRAMPDLIAGNGEVYYAIEVKMRKNLPVYISEGQVHELYEFSDRFGAIPLIAVKLPYKAWKFINALELKRTGKGYKIDSGLYWSALSIDEVLGGDKF